MSDDFEHNISQRMDGFELTPSPQVWERVEAALPEKRRRRIAIWWWLPLAACLGGGVWLMVIKQSGTKKEIITGATKKPPAEYTGNGEKLLKQSPGDTVKNDVAIHQQMASTDKKNNSNQPTDKISKETIINKKETKTNSYLRNGTVALQRATAKAKRSKAIAETEGPVAKKQSSADEEPLGNVTLKLNAAGGNMRLKMPVSSDSFLTRIPVPLLEDSFINHLTVTIIAKDTALLENADTVLKTFAEARPPQLKKKINKPEWSLTVGVGKSNLINDNSIKLGSASRNDYNLGGPVFTPSGPSNGVVRTTGVFSNPKSGFDFNAGITRSQAISRHFSWQATISYQLLTSIQRIGRPNDSLLRVTRLNDSLQNKSSSGTSAAFFTGSTANYTNKIHRMQVATGVAYILNPAARSPVRFATGGFVAYNLSNNLLLHDYRSFSYIRSAELSNKWMWGGEIGFDVFINQTIKAGVFYQHDFTKVGKPKVGSAFRWNQLQLRVGIPLSKH